MIINRDNSAMVTFSQTIIDINGTKYIGSSMDVDNDGNVSIDGINQDNFDQSKEINITIQGDANTVTNTNGMIKCNNVQGDVNNVNGPINCNNVTGNVTSAAGAIKCANVEGNVKNDIGNIKCDAVHGKVKTVMGNIKMR